MKKYRIIKDTYGSYEVQKQSFFGNWSAPVPNGFETIKDAREFIERGLEVEVVEYITK